jgi:MFS family permease
MINTFGVFQSYYEATLLPAYSASSISWIGTTQGFLLFLAGIVVGPFFDKGYLKHVISAGTFLVVFGLMMTSLSTEYYQVFLAHGLLVGIGCACLFLPSVAIVATYFTTNRAFAMGITATGGSIGKLHSHLAALALILIFERCYNISGDVP